ncbi:MAG: DUF2783 domain-containing protein [Rhodospirillales bacterium]|nr:DUF2783 domain-containing protein [Rhodospirillales bacterium]
MAQTLRNDSGFADPDEVYAALIECHQGLSEEQSARVNARLVLLLANHIGNFHVISEALAAAREGI